MGIGRYAEHATTCHPPQHMTPEERRALLGDDVIARIHEEADAAPPPPPEVIAVLRPILTNPAGQAEPPSADPP